MKQFWGLPKLLEEMQGDCKVPVSMRTLRRFLHDHGAEVGVDVTTELGRSLGNILVIRPPELEKLKRLYEKTYNHGRPPRKKAQPRCKTCGHLHEGCTS